MSLSAGNLQKNYTIALKTYSFQKFKAQRGRLKDVPAGEFCRVLDGEQQTSRRMLSRYRSSGVQLPVEGHQFGGQLLRQPQISRMVRGQPGRLGQPKRTSMVDFDDLNGGHASVQRDCRQQRIAPIWSTDYTASVGSPAIAKPIET